jgi:hypothetical protein
MVPLVIALVVVRLLDPASKLTTARLLDGTTATSSLGTVLALGKVDEQELYDALDWLLAQQERIETALARRHLSHGTLVLYDVSLNGHGDAAMILVAFRHGLRASTAVYTALALGGDQRLTGDNGPADIRMSCSGKQAARRRWVVRP